MTLLNAGVLFAAALIGGTLNSVAGGGSFIAFPALVFTGVPPINANATTTVALWPGAVTGAIAYRRELVAQRSLLILFGCISGVGGVVGAVLLLLTPANLFQALIPYLVLGATVLFAIGGRVSKILRKKSANQLHQKASQSSLIATAIMQFLISVYGGFFGGGIGILMLAMFALMGMENIHEMNASKTLLAALINGVAVVTFIVAGAVFWLQALLMVSGAIIGGYGGAYYARQLNPSLVRAFIILFGLSTAFYFFVRR